jgi:hypothetical protein
MSDSVEKEVEELLASYDAGDIDNAWDVLPALHELNEKLAKDSPLRERFDAMYEEIEELCRES